MNDEPYFNQNVQSLCSFVSLNSMGITRNTENYNLKMDDKQSIDGFEKTEKVAETQYESGVLCLWVVIGA